MAYDTARLLLPLVVMVLTRPRNSGAVLSHREMTQPRRLLCCPVGGAGGGRCYGWLFNGGTTGQRGCAYRLRLVW